MTGFGKFEAAASDGSILTAEISSVNRKQLEIRANLPQDMMQFEPLARKLLSGAVSRGSVTLRVSRSAGRASAAGVRVNRELFELLGRECMALRVKLGLTPDFDPAAILALPQVLENVSGGTGEPEFARSFENAVTGALDKFIAMRETEGGALKDDMYSRLQLLEDILDRIAPFAGEISANIKARLVEKLTSEDLPADVNDERFLRELLFYADKSDVTEEIVRLKSHFSQFRKFLQKDGEPVGRSLDFLVQEMFREITTLSNKAGTADVSPLAVTFKSELEKIREQVQNVE